MFNKRPKVEFFSVLPELTQLAPIISARDHKPTWFTKAAKDLGEAAQRPHFGKQSSSHIAKCPGIANLIKYGWILTTWQDIVITTNGDKQTFKWESALDQSKYDAPAVSFMGKEMLSDYQGGWDDSLNCIIKINTPWRCIVPKGYYLLEGPVPYSDDTRFTTMPGFFSQEHGVAQLNIQLKWHVLEDKVLIKAGTPIAHYMLVPKDQPEMSVVNATPEQLEADRVTALENSRRFVSDSASKKCVFARLFK